MLPLTPLRAAASWLLVLFIESFLPGSSLSASLQSGSAPPQSNPASHPAVTVESILERWARAVGGPERLAKIENIYIKSWHEGTGGDGDVEEWTTRAGQRRQWSRLEDDPVIVAFDGTVGWQQRSGRARKLGIEEVAGQRTAALIGAHAHLVPGHPGVRAELLGDDESGRCHVVRVHPDGGKGTVFHVDRTTWLPTRNVQQFPGTTVTFQFVEWKDVDGVKLPSKSQISSEDGYQAAETLKEVRFNVPLDATFFGRPPDGPKNFRFLGSETAPAIPFETDGGHIFVQGRIEGSPPVWITLDTGASGSLIDTDFARSVGLELSGGAVAVGPAGSVEASNVRRATVHLHGVEMTVSSAQAIPMEFLSRGCARKVVAILGYDFFARFVVELDYAERRMRLRDPDGFAYSGAGEAIPFTLHDDQPYVRAQLEVGKGRTLEGELVVDLGSANTLMLARDFEAQHAILAAAGEPLRERAGGVGGQFEIRVARIEAMQLGSFTITRPVTLFPTGQITAPGKAGNVGVGFLRRFRVIFDYARERMILEPTPRVSDPDEFDMSGLRLAGAGPSFESLRVVRVADDSPAAKAGLKLDDVLEKVNGRPAAERGLAGVRELTRRDGAELDLTVRRGDSVRNVRLKLKRRI